LNEQGGAVVEVNAGPGLLMHLKPAVGKPRPVGRAIVEALFPEDAEQLHPGRIPIVGIAGSRGTTRIARLVTWLAQLRGLRVGLACAEGLYFDRRVLASGDARRFDVAHRLLVNRNVQAAVFENDARCVLRDGLPYDRCTVGVVTDLDGAETLADFDVQTPEHMFKALRTQVDVVLDDGVAVLNAADERIAAMAELCDGESILYAADPSTPALKAHRAAGARGGRVVFLREGRPVLATGSAETRLAILSRTARGDMDDESLLAVVATAWALDIPPDLIIAGIETFDAHNAAL
jgi:cyanophycin synthetase